MKMLEKRLLLFLSIVVILLSNQTYSQQTNLDSVLAFLSGKEKLMLEYHQDFTNYFQSFENNTSEREIVNDILGIINTTGDDLDASHSLLYVYKLISKDDRVKIFSVIKVTFKYYLDRLNESIRYLDNQVAFTKSVAVATSGANLRKELREIKNFYEIFL